MKRYTILFRSHSTGTAIPVDTSETPADALKIAQRAVAQDLREVKIFDGQTQEALDPPAFAAKHRL
jgi:hypothetical protein